MIEDFLGELARKNYSPHTLRNYRRTLATFQESLAGGDMLEATAADVRRFLAAQGQISPSTRLLHLAAMKSFAAFLKRHHGGAPFCDVAASLRGPKRQALAPKALNEGDMQSIISLASRPDAARESWQTAQDRAIILALYGTGLRAAEILSLPKDVGFGTTLRVAGKGQKERIIPVLPVVQQAVDAYRRLAPDTNRRALFQTLAGGDLTGNALRKIVRGFREVLGLPGHVTPHAFRHTFATHMHQNGADIIALSHLLGHASARTTAIYTRVDERSLLRTLQNCYGAEYMQTRKDAPNGTILEEVSPARYLDAVG
jgi:integrase/recombinase XerC